MHISTRILLVAGLATVAGCSQYWQAETTRSGASSSLVDYLYPEGTVPPAFDEKVPQLRLPLRVGLAFVPPARSPGAQSVLSEADRAALLDRVRAKFTDREYISSIEVIPETYLRSTKGFDGVGQVARLYGVDVMALVSYDQVSAIGDNKLSLTYWTIVGAYLIKGTENEVNTFVDTAVFDMGTRKLLFRAPGMDQRQRSSTAVESSGKLRDISNNSFVAATDQMASNLSSELDRFEQRLKDEPKLAAVTWREGSSGGGGMGAADGWLITILLSLAALRRPCRRSAAGARSRAAAATLHP